MALTKIPQEQVEKLADLCNLKLSSEETAKLSEMLSDTLSYIDVLNELDTTAVAETFQVTGLTNVFMQKGNNITTLSHEDALANGNDTLEDKFVTQAVFDR